VLEYWTIGHVFWTDDTHKSQFYRIYALGPPNISIGEKMNVRTSRSKRFVRMTVIALGLAAAYSPLAASQETKKEPELCRRSSEAAFPCPFVAPAKETAETKNRQAPNLPDTPQPQGQSNLPNSPSIPQDQNSALLFLSVKSSRSSLSFGDKFTIYAHQTFGPPALILPAFRAGMGMANPTNHYPREWKDGPGAFGRLYGDSIATVTSQRTARFLTGVALHEDPRYVRSTSKNPLLRTAHALAFTLVDKTDSGRNTIAFSNFAGAAAGGFVGRAYLPHGYNDITHAEQRMALQFSSMAIQNIAAEFQPQWGPLVRKLRINKIIPEWWVPQHQK
jgi:hypothetical protein